MSESIQSRAEGFISPGLESPFTRKGTPSSNGSPMTDTWWRGIKNRLFQHLARFGPGSMTLRVHLHRARGVRIGQGAWIGYDVILDTSSPSLITIGDRATISVRACVIAHFREVKGVEIGPDVFIGPGAII